MPFTDPFKSEDHIVAVRKIGRLAQVLLDLRSEYEQKPRRTILEQIVERIDEITELRAELSGALVSAQPAEANETNSQV
ncbi:MAG: hypothetical protein ACR2M0_16560 [Chloroflexia bacterium]